MPQSARSSPLGTPLPLIVVQRRHAARIGEPRHKRGFFVATPLRRDAIPSAWPRASTRQRDPVRRSIRSARTPQHAITDTCCYTFAVRADAAAASHNAKRAEPRGEGGRNSRDGDGFRSPLQVAISGSRRQAARTRCNAVATSSSSKGSTFTASLSSYAYGICSSIYVICDNSSCIACTPCAGCPYSRVI